MSTRQTTLGLAILVLVTFIASPSVAQITLPGPYYSTPSWDQKLPVFTRFIILSNWNSEAVLDRETGLVWERSPNPSLFKWAYAHLRCNQLTLGNRMGWRLPTIQELASLVDPLVVGVSLLALPAGHPFDTDCTTGGCVQPSHYWSATTDVFTTDNAWDVGFFNGGFVVQADKDESDRYVWCVRGGQGVDAQ